MFRSKLGYTEERFFPGVIATVDFRKNYVFRFHCFLKNLKAKQGDKYYIHEYSVWVYHQWSEFNKLNDMPEYYPLTDVIQDQFDEFLRVEFSRRNEQITLF